MATFESIEEGLASLPQTRLPDGSILSFRVEGIGPVLARWSEPESSWEAFRSATGPATPAVAAAPGLDPERNLGDLVDVAAARKALGLGEAATARIGDGRGQVAAGDHQHHEFAHLFTATAEQLSMHIDRMNRIEDGAATREANLGDLADAAAARDHLGLGPAALASIGTEAGDVASGDHRHPVTDAAVAQIAERVSGLAGATLTAARNLADVEDKEKAREHLGLRAPAVADFGTEPGTVAAGDHRHAGTLAAAKNLADVPDVAAARKALGLGGAAVLELGHRRGTVAPGDHQHRAALLDVTQFGWDDNPAVALAAAAAAVAEFGALGVAIPAGRWTVGTLPVDCGRIEGAGSATVLTHENAGHVFAVTGAARIAHLVIEGTVDIAVGGATLDDVDVDQITVRSGVAGLAMLNVRFTGYGPDIVAAEDARDLRAVACAFSGGIDAPGGVHVAACSGDSRTFVPAQPEIDTGDSGE